MFNIITQILLKLKKIFEIIMNFIDIILLIILIFFALRGYRRGFVYEIFSIGIIVIGLLASFLFFKQVAIIFNQYFNNRDLSLILAFLAIFIGVSISLITMRNILSNLIESLNLTDIDSILGLLLAVVKTVLVVSIILLFLENHPVFDLDKPIKRSFVFPYIKRVFFAFMSLLPIKIRLIIYSIL